MVTKKKQVLEILGTYQKKGIYQNGYRYCSKCGRSTLERICSEHRILTRVRPTHPQSDRNVFRY